MGLREKVDALLSEAEEMLQSDAAARRQWAEWEARCDQVLDRWNELAQKAADLMTEEECRRLDEAIEQANHMKGGPLGDWILDLERGRCRLPDLSAETMRQLLLAWLSPDLEDSFSGMLCGACGLEIPCHRHPPTSEWKLLPGKQWGVGPPPWYDLPEFFRQCPNCGASLCASQYGGVMDWPRLIDDKTYPWMQLDGYAGKQPKGKPETENQR
jgi:hypothetical protein